MSHLKLTRIEIQNFRKFRDPFVLDLVSPSGEPLNYVVLAGPNGSGKTTVLEAILLATGKEGQVWPERPSVKELNQSRQLLEPNTRLSLSVRDRQNDYSYRFNRTSSDHRVERLLSDGSYRGTFRYPGDPTFEKLTVEYLSSRRVQALVGPVQDAIRGRPPEATEANRIWTFKHRVRQQQGRRVPDYEGPEPLDRVWMERLNVFWHEFRNDQTRLKMTLVDPGNLDVSEWDLFLYEGNRRICAVDALSSGEQEIIALVAPFITEPFDGVLLFDEPELHMHPQWQGRVLRALRKVIPDAQVIVSTHADDPWDAAMSWERFLLVPNDDPRARVASEAE